MIKLWLFAYKSAKCALHDDPAHCAREIIRKSYFAGKYDRRWGGRVQRLIAFAAVLIPGGAMAQANLQGSWQWQGQTPGQLEQETGFGIGPGETIEHDSNLLRASGQTGSPVVANTLFNTDLAGWYHQIFGREDLSLAATVGRVHYLHSIVSAQTETVGGVVQTVNVPQDFDYTAEDLRAGLKSNLAGDINVNLDASRTTRMAQFADTGTAIKNVIATNAADGLIDVPVVADFRAELGGNAHQNRNSSGFFSTQDLNVYEVDGGARYSPTTGNHVDLLARSANGIYPNGSPSVFISPGYHDKGVDLRVDWTFSGASRALGHAGYVKRTNDVLETSKGPLDRDFAGPIVDLTYIWQTTSATKLTFYGSRQVGAAGDDSYLSGVTRDLKFTPSWQPTAKIDVGAYIESIHRDYFTNVYAIVTDTPPGTTRVDNSVNYGLSLVWNPTRWLQTALELYHEHRDSTLSEWDYRNNVVNLSLQTSF
jgi:hypothetical protein